MTKEHPYEPNLYLIGFMGVGKSAVGRALARALRMRYVDVDHVIEKQAGKPIEAIFREDGEGEFRRMERAFMDGGHPAGGQVISCGGGLPFQPGMREMLLASGVVVCLFAKAETILARTLGNSKRPLLNVEDPEARVRGLMAEREPLYLRTGIGVSTDGRPISEVVQSIVRIYRREQRLRKQPDKAHGKR
jgi:shikimate kinase